MTRIVSAVIVVEFVAALALIVYAAAHDLRDVFAGAPPAVPSRIAASCIASAESAACGTSIVELNAGRYRVATTGGTGTLVVTLTPERADAVRQLLVKASQPPTVRLTITGSPADTPGASDGGSAIELTDAGNRSVLEVPAAPLTLRFVPSADALGAPIVIDEVGLFESPAGLMSDERPFFKHIPPSRYHEMLVARGIAALCLFTIAAAVFVPPAALRRSSPVLLAVMAFSLSVLDLAVLYSPFWAHDLRSFYASGPLLEHAGNNLNTGLWQASRLLTGDGLTLPDGTVPWERMPGYGLFCAVAGLTFGHRTIVELATSVVLLQTIFYGAAVGVFAWAAAALMPPAAVWAVGMLVAWLPKQLGHTQVDAVVAPIALIVLACLCVRLKWSRDGRPIPLRLDILVHAAFALWFLMRPDVVPGWIAVALILHWRHWRRLLVPVALFAAIGITWGAYKARHTGEFSVTTASAGAALFCGLWEVPSRFRFAQSCTDEMYFDWVRQNTTLHPQSAAANTFATREVLKFWLTYPGHLVVMICHKAMRFVDGDVWSGYTTQLQASVFVVVRRFWVIVPLLTVLLLCAVVGYERERTLLLAWPLFFDAPLFWIMFASLGRFYSGVGVALVAASVPPLFERSFYSAMAAQPRRAAAVLAAAAVFAVTAWPLHDWLLGQDAFHYWAPLLDPSRSSLSGFK